MFQAFIHNRDMPSTKWPVVLLTDKSFTKIQWELSSDTKTIEKTQEAGCRSWQYWKENQVLMFKAIIHNQDMPSTKWPVVLFTDKSFTKIQWELSSETKTIEKTQEAGCRSRQYWKENQVLMFKAIIHNQDMPSTKWPVVLFTDKSFTKVQWELSSVTKTIEKHKNLVAETSVVGKKIKYSG